MSRLADQGIGWIVVHPTVGWCGRIHETYTSALVCQAGRAKNPKTMPKGSKVMRSCGWDEKGQPLFGVPIRPDPAELETLRPSGTPLEDPTYYEKKKFNTRWIPVRLLKKK